MYRLQQLMPAAVVTVLESSDRPGGTIWTLCEDGFKLEAVPNGFLDTKTTTKSLCHDLGLADQLLGAVVAATAARSLGD